MENHRPINEPHDNHDAATSASDNRSSKNDGGSRNTERDAGNAKKYGKYTKSGNGTI